MTARTVSSIRMFGAVATSLGTIATIFAPGILKAQQLAATDVASDRQAYLASECNHIRDLNERTGCYGEATIRFNEILTARAKQGTGVITKRIGEIDQRIDQIDKRIDASKTAAAESTCHTQILEGHKSGDARFAPERGKVILNGKRPSEFGYCRFLSELTKS